MARNPRSVRLTRAQRRELEREQEKQHRAEVRRREPSQISPIAIWGGALTILVVLAILAYALIRNGSSTSTPANGDLVDPNGLHPNSSLLAVGSKAPDFTLLDAKGKPYSLGVYMGEPMVLEFFAVWCPICHAEAPAMTKLTATYVPRNVHVWSVLANPYGRGYETSGRTDLRIADKADLSWYASTYKVNHPQLIDSTFSVTNQFGAGSYPTIYILDGYGVVRYAHTGNVSYATLSAALDRVIHQGA